MKLILFCFTVIIYYGSAAGQQEDKKVTKKLLIDVPCFSKADRIYDNSLVTLFSRKKISNPFVNLVQTPITNPVNFRITGKNINYQQYIHGFNPQQYHLTQLPVWKEVMTLAGQIALSAYASKRNLIYVSPK